MAIEIVLKLPWFTPSHKGVECLVAQPRNQEPIILSCFSKRPGGTPLSGRRGPRRPPTGADYPTGGPRRPLRESTLGLGSTLQRVRVICTFAVSPCGTFCCTRPHHHCVVRCRTTWWGGMSLRVCAIPMQSKMAHWFI